MCFGGDSHVRIRTQQLLFGWKTSLAQSVIQRQCVILGQPFPWNVPALAKEKSLQWNAHITQEKHNYDLKRPESEKTGTEYVSLLCLTGTDVSVSVAT